MENLKFEKIGRLSTLIIKERMKLEPAKLNIQSLAKQGKVSRPWIYKYFGSTEQDMILNAIDCLAPQITQLTKDDDIIISKKDWARVFLKSLDQALKDVEVNPEVYQFYFLSMIFPNEFTERLKHHEDLYLRQRVIPKIKSGFGLNQSEARAFAELILSLRLGVILNWLKETERSTYNRSKILTSIKRNIFDILKEGSIK